MNEPTLEPTPETPVAKKRGRPPNPKPQTIPTAEGLKEPTPGIILPLDPVQYGQIKSAIALHVKPPDAIQAPPKAESQPRLGDLYAAIDAAPVEWLPSILSKVVRRALKAGLWSSVENLVLSVKGFSK